MARIRIYDDAGVRYLKFGRHWLQGAMRLSHTWSLDLGYTRDMMLPLLLRGGDWPRSVLQIGLGAGSITRFLHRYRPRARLTVVELDAEVILNAWPLFRLPPESDRLEVVHDDGYRYLRCTRRRFDLILVDGFDARARAGVLDTPRFYRACRARLTGSGMLAANLVGTRQGKAASIERVSQAFDGRALPLPPRDSNTVVLAALGARIHKGADRLAREAAALESSSGLDLAPVLQRLLRATAGPTLVL